MWWKSLAICKVSILVSTRNVLTYTILYEHNVEWNPMGFYINWYLDLRILCMWLNFACWSKLIAWHTPEGSTEVRAETCLWSHNNWVQTGGAEGGGAAQNTGGKYQRYINESVQFLSTVQACNMVKWPSRWINRILFTGRLKCHHSISKHLNSSGLGEFGIRYNVQWQQIIDTFSDNLCNYGGYGIISHCLLLVTRYGDSAD